MKFQILIFLIFLYSTLAAQQPSPRAASLIAYDETNNQILVYGGGGENRILSDLWSLKNSVWKKLSDNGPKRIKSAFAYDTDRNRAVLFGGTSPESVAVDETWEWDGKQWKQISLPGPSARNHTLGIYDRKHKYVLIFGGFGAEGALSDTWAYDGNQWKQMDSNGPKNCIANGIVYDEIKEKVILITAAISTDPNSKTPITNKIWEWSGNSWTIVSHNGPVTSPNSLQALASFGKSEIVLFDGDDVSNNRGKTWKFSQGQWTGLSLDGPSPRMGVSMAYDKSRNRTILFGGTDRTHSFNDLWEWDGKQWHIIVNP